MASNLIDFPGDPQNTNRRFVIVGNLIANSQKAGIGLMPNANTVEDFSGADIVEPVRVFNNTFYGNNHGISGGDDLVAFNNIITNSTGRGVWKVQGPPGSNSVVAHTLFFNNSLDADQSTMGPGIITGQDPLFSAAPNPGPDGAWETVDDDFSGLLLQSSSPAIDKGVTQYTAVSGELIPASPLTGFIGAAPDLGWREFGSPIVHHPDRLPHPLAYACHLPDGSSLDRYIYIHSCLAHRDRRHRDTAAHHYTGHADTESSDLYIDRHSAFGSDHHDYSYHCTVEHLERYAKHSAGKHNCQRDCERNSLCKRRNRPV